MNDNSDLMSEQVLYSIRLHSCSKIARKNNAFRAFCKDHQAQMKTETFRKYIKYMRDNLLDSQFCRMRTSGQVLRTFIIMSALMCDDGDEATASLARLAKKHFSSIVGRAGKEEFPRIRFFASQTPNVEGIIESVMLYTFVLAAEATADNVMTLGDTSNEIMDCYKFAADLLMSPGKEASSHRAEVTEGEKAVRQQLEESQGRMMMDFFKDTNKAIVQMFSEDFLNSDFLTFRMTEKDTRTVARCITTAIAASVSGAKIYDREDDPDYDDLMSPERQTLFEEARRNAAAAREATKTANLNYPRMIYAFSKLQREEKKEVIDFYLELAEQEAAKKEIHPDERLKQIATEKDTVIEQKQSQLNRMQIELDKANKKLVEAKEKYIEAKSTLEDTQKLFASIQEGKVKVNDTDGETPASFPANTVLFGGHPNWLRKFRLKYPSVRVYDADDMSFTTDVIRNAELILFNVTHMSHKQYGPVIKAARQYHKNVEYIK